MKTHEHTQPHNHAYEARIARGQANLQEQPEKTAQHSSHDNGEHCPTCFNAGYDLGLVSMRSELERVKAERDEARLSKLEAELKRANFCFDCKVEQLREAKAERDELLALVVEFVNTDKHVHANLEFRALAAIAKHPGASAKINRRQT